MLSCFSIFKMAMKEELTSFHSEKVRKKVDISENVL